MGQRYYRSGQFARKTAVSVRTLRYYDREGLLAPSRRTEAGYRLYTDDDLVRLEQIRALKFLGFSLDEIRVYLNAPPQGLEEALRQQWAMACERRDRLNIVIQAIEEAGRLLQADGSDWGPITKVIRAIQMEQNTDWQKKYFTEDQLRTIEELGTASYSHEARENLASLHPNEWTEEDQKRVDERYDALHAGVRRLVAEGGDPGSPEAQS
ncbi:MAG: MerR family transcriptional regulator, partial [Chloroflexia bacterium]|nr:MerR family transcriptional regulator [Chloroflexia bacterium]